MKNLLKRVNLAICEFDETVVQKYLDTGEFTYNYSLELTNAEEGWVSEYHPCALAVESDSLWEALCKEFDVETLYKKYEEEDHNPDYYSFGEFLNNVDEISDFIYDFKDDFYDEQVYETLYCSLLSGNFVDRAYIGFSYYEHCDILVDYKVFDVLVRQHKELLQNKTVDEILRLVGDFSYYFKKAYEEATEDMSEYELQDFDADSFLEKWLAEEIANEE